MLNALVVDDDTNFATGLAEYLARRGFHSSTAGNLAAARQAQTECAPDVIFLDLKLPDGDGIDLAEEMCAASDARVVVITGNSSVSSAMASLRARVWDYIQKPLDPAYLERCVASLRQPSAGADRRPAASDVRGPAQSPLVGESVQSAELRKLVQRFAAPAAPVLIHGETGTGKEIIARELHRVSGRTGALEILNCGALTETLIASELFGHERGSFTGAHRQHFGAFERAAGGTVFLDEITEMPLQMQAALLRVLEDGSLTRVGGREQIRSDARVIAATNRDPATAVATGQLREDLYYRVQVCRINVPPLRDRRDDILPLARHFLASLNAEYGTSKRFSAAAESILVEANWPGNVRELKNTVHRACLLAAELIEAEAIELDPGAEPAARQRQAAAREWVGSSLSELERELIHATLEHHRGDKKSAANVLGISLKTLYNRLHAYRKGPV